MDDIVVKRAIKGNKEATAIIINEIQEKSYRIAMCYLQNEHDALDAHSNAILQTFRHIKRLKNPSYFSTWFTKVLINECKKIMKRGSRVIYYNELLDNISHTDNHDTIDLKILLGKLPETERMIIYLKYYQGYTLHEISKILEIPEGTVKTRLYRQLQELRKQLQGMEERKSES
jgi:RNA polymerase sigma-70 factor (ECF subfamily)